MRGPHRPFVAALSATVLMASTLGTLVWLGAVLVVAFVERGLQSFDILSRHWDVDHMGVALAIAAFLTAPFIVWLAALYFRAAWRAERDLREMPGSPGR